MAHDFTDEDMQNCLPMLVGIAKTHDIPAQDRMDIAQQSIADALKKIRGGRFRGDCEVATFVGAIAKRRISDYLRNLVREKRSCHLPVGDDTLSDSASLSRRVGTQPGDLFLKASVHEALRMLSGKRRAILLLSKFEGLSLKQVAAKLNMRPGTVGRELAEAAREFMRPLEGQQDLRR